MQMFSLGIKAFGIDAIRLGLGDRLVERYCEIGSRFSLAFFSLFSLVISLSLKQGCPNEASV